MGVELGMICWDTPDRLALGIQVTSPIGHAADDVEQLVQLDTGYSGEVLIPYALFIQLKLNQWRLPQTVNATTVTGARIQLVEAHAQVVIPRLSERQRVVVQTFEGNSRFLIGRALLRRVRVLLDGPNGQTCLLPAGSSVS